MSHATTPSRPPTAMQSWGAFLAPVGASAIVITISSCMVLMNDVEPVDRPSEFELRAPAAMGATTTRNFVPDEDEDMDDGSQITAPVVPTKRRSLGFSPVQRDSGEPEAPEAPAVEEPEEEFEEDEEEADEPRPPPTPEERARGRERIRRAMEEVPDGVATRMPLFRSMRRAMRNRDAQAAQGTGPDAASEGATNVAAPLGAAGAGNQP